jgi:hypothetical protein
LRASRLSIVWSPNDLGSIRTKEPGSEIIGEVADRLTEDDAPLAMLAGDMVVEVASLVRGSVLTHRLNASDLDLGVLTASTFDLAGFVRFDDLRLGDGGEIEAFSVNVGPDPAKSRM